MGDIGKNPRRITVIPDHRPAPAEQPAPVTEPVRSPDREAQPA